MSKTKTFAFFLLLFLRFSAIGQSAVNYPKPVGFVNDFAGILSNEVKNTLENKLKDYKEKTSIELVIVTVSSLEGETVEEYTIGLAQTWGVGKKKKDNGIVVLVASNERKVRVETGYGIEPNITDAQASQIIRNDIIPLFKENKMSEGIVAGVDSIIKTLGLMPFATRAEERRLAEEKKKKESEIAKQKIKGYFKTIGIVALFLTPLTIIFLLVKKYREEKNHLKTLHVNNADLIKVCQALIEKIEKSLPLAEIRLTNLKEKIPEEQKLFLGDLREKAIKNLPVLKKDLTTVTTVHLKHGWKKADLVSIGIGNVLNGLEEASKFYEAIENKVTELNEAEKKSQKLLAEIPKLLTSLGKELNHPDASKEVKDSLEKARTEFDKAKNLVRDIKSSWLTIFAGLSAVEIFLFVAKEKGTLDRREAERARKEGPELLTKIPSLISKAEKAVDNSDVSKSAKNLVQDAKNQLEKARNSAKQDPVNWLLVFPILLFAAGLAERANKKAKEDIEEAEEEKRRKRQREKNSHSSYSTGISIGGNNRGGSSFGGFGGGSFGGGGASGSW